MKIVGLTGGIGSGKTTVAKMFVDLGVPIYIADIEAKQLMNTSKEIQTELIELFGNNAYINGVLNRTYLADQIFNNKELLNKMNAIVHPRVNKHFKDWLSQQDSTYVIKEVAILFENGSYKSCDVIIMITAPIEDRINRVISRDNSSREKVKSIMNNQWPDKKKIELSQYVIYNTDLEETKNQVQKIHLELLKKSD